jgi:hypothetical protein
MLQWFDIIGHRPRGELEESQARSTTQRDDRAAIETHRNTEHIRADPCDSTSNGQTRREAGTQSHGSGSSSTEAPGPPGCRMVDVIRASGRSESTTPKPINPFQVRGRMTRRSNFLDSGAMNETTHLGLIPGPSVRAGVHGVCPIGRRLSRPHLNVFHAIVAPVTLEKPRPISGRCDNTGDGFDRPE